MMKRRQIYLVPGFLGFSNIGGLNYFQGVRKVLSEALARQGVEAEIIECRTKPTASIRHRAERLVDEVCKNGGLEAEQLHFVGHSTGGLDARLLCTPSVRLRTDTRIERDIVARTRSVITMATPHFGTPLASFFMTVLGRQLLEAIAALATSRSGQMGILGTAQLVGLTQGARELIGRDRTRFLDTVSKKFVSLTTESGEDMWAYFREIASDQGAMVQLMPEAMHLFNAAVTDHQTIRYSSLVAISPPPLTGYNATDLLSPVRIALAAVFILLHNTTASEHRHYPYPNPAEEVLASYEEALPYLLNSRSNDGIVPTLSQVYGRVIDIVVADHLDVVGHFKRNDFPQGDWLPSGSHYDRAHFEKTWDGVAEEIMLASAG